MLGPQQIQPGPHQAYRQAALFPLGTGVQERKIQMGHINNADFMASLPAASR